MNHSLKEALKSYNAFSAEEVDQFLSLLTARRIDKGEKVLDRGQVCQEISFINEGSFIQYYRDEEINEVVENLFVKGDWLLSRSSFTSQKPSRSQIEAFEDSQIVTISIHDLHHLIGRQPSFFAMGKILEVIHPNADPKRSPDEKYQLLLDERPEIVQTFPLKYIASYLGMTAETLSRVRARMK